MRRLLLVLPLLAAGCGEDRPLVVEGRSIAESSAPCVAASPVADPLPRDFPQPPPGAVLTAVAPVQVTGRVDAEVEQVLAHFQAAVDAAGYIVQREEDEGRSAQLAFFGARNEGSIVIAAVGCPRGSTGFTMRLRSPAS